ncbi:MAG: lipopolysaccharide biosynthesis protein [Chloroflexi bacterium]|nr:lipopolysaccharide biosynthesis protein [Chloroflexota bacterium]
MTSEADTRSAFVKKKAIQGTFWSYLSFIIGKLLSFATTIILARLLLPEEFGLVGYATVVIDYLDVLNTLGMGTAIISRKDRIEEASNIAFYSSTILSIVLYLLAWVAAPFAAAYFSEPAVTPLLRVIALTLPIYALGAIPGAHIQKNLRFKIKIIPDFSRSFSKGLVSVVLAWAGFGVWSLIWGQIVSAFIVVILNWILGKWRPTRVFDRQVSKEMLTFGGHIVAIGFIGVLLNNVDYLIVGRVLGAAALGYYTLAYRMPELVIRTINLGVDRVAHPILSTLQWDQEQLRSVYRNYLRYTSLAILPAGVGLAILSAPIIRIFYSSEWLASIPVMRWIAIAVMVGALGHIPGVLYKAINRPDILNKLALIKLPLTIAILWYGSRWGIVGVALGHVLLAFIKVTLDTVVAGRFVNFGLWQVFKTISPAFWGAIIMGAAILPLHLIPNFSDIPKLITAIILGAGVFIAIVYWLDPTLIHKSKSMLRGVFQK